MSFDEQFRPAIDNLTARLRRDIERHLDAAVEELTARAETLAAADEAARAAALEQAARAAWAEAEQIAAEKFAAERAEAEQEAVAHLATERERMEQETVARLATERERMEQDTVARLAAARAEMERLALERLEAERAETERATAERLMAEYAAAERATLDRLTVERLDGERALAQRHADEKADLDRAAAERLAAETDAAAARTALRFHALDRAAGDRLVHAFRTIDAAQSLSEILETLAAAVAAEAPRVGVFLADGEQFRSWRLEGFEPAIAAADKLTLSSDAAGIIAEAGRARAPLIGGAGAEWLAPAFAELPAHRISVAVPLIVNGEVVVALYADEGIGGDVERASWPATVEVLARHASRALEAITAHRLARMLSERSGLKPRPAPRPPSVSSVASASPVAAAASGPSLFSVAAAVVSAPVPAAPAIERPPLVNPAPSVVIDEYAVARQLARELVSEIRMANESEIFAGLRERNLMVRLGGEIARAWEQYEARVPESIRANTNYFHAEMVKTLANGDASLLSPNP